MQARFIHDGKAIDYFPSSDVASGTVVIQGDLVGVTKEDIPAGRLGTLHVVGVYDISKGSGEITLGTKLYWDATAKQAVVTETGNKQLGIAVLAATASDATVRVRIG